MSSICIKSGKQITGKHNHFFSGKTEVEPQLRSILYSLTQISEQLIPSESSIEQYKTLVKYLCFVASAAKVTVSENIVQQTGKIIQEFGTAENIQTWCLTPMQLDILSNADGMPFVALIGGNGTGKTMLLKEVAKQAASQGKNVVYFIFNAFKTLIFHLLKRELEAHNIKVMNLIGNIKPFLQDWHLKNYFICIDEIWDEDQLLVIFQSVDIHIFSGVWVVLNSKKTAEVDKNFNVIKLDLALRNTKAITRQIKTMNDVYFFLDNNMNSTLQTIEHMPEGQDVITIKRYANQNFETMFKRGINNLSSETKALICVTSRFLEVCLDPILSCFEEKRRPLVYTVETFRNDTNEDIIKWIDNSKSFKDRPLITDEGRVPGFEADEVIGCGEDALRFFISRARVKFIHIDVDNDMLQEMLP